MKEVNPSADRYRRQIVLPEIGAAGQSRLATSRVLLVGCGALGSHLAESLVRAGVGFLRLVDRDLVEWSNLPRQVLFDESDAANQLPKAVAAGQRLREVNSLAAVESVVADVNPGNIESLVDMAPSPMGSDNYRGDGEVSPHPDPLPEYRARGDREQAGLHVDLILDGTDNVATRYLLNDVAVKLGIPWIYGACVGVGGRVMAIWPGKTACLRCIFPEPPAAHELPTCDTAGVLGPAAAAVAALQSAAALRLLVEGQSFLKNHPGLVSLDLWNAQFHAFQSARDAQPDCPCCAAREFPFLESNGQDFTASLCGRNSVQVQTAKTQSIQLKSASERLSSAGTLHWTPYFVRCRLHEPAGIELTLFPDGRLLVHGTTDPMRARALYARFVGQ